MSNRTYDKRDQYVSQTSIIELATGVEVLELNHSISHFKPDQDGVTATKNQFTFGGSNTEPIVKPVSVSTKRKFRVPDDDDEEEGREWIRNNPAKSPVLRRLFFGGVQIGEFEQLTVSEASRSKATSGSQASSQLKSEGPCNGGGRSSSGGKIGESVFGQMRPQAGSSPSVGVGISADGTQQADELTRDVKRLKIEE